MLPPQASANQPDTIDDDHVAVGPWGQLVVQLERDVIWVIGLEDLTKRDRTGLFWASGDDVAVGRIYLDPVVNLDTCLLYTSPSPRDGLLSRMPSSA